MMEQVVNIDRMEQVVGLFGSFDTNIRTLENEYHVTIVVRDGELQDIGGGGAGGLGLTRGDGAAQPAAKGGNPQRSEHPVCHIAGQRGQ